MTDVDSALQAWEKSMKSSEEDIDALKRSYANLPSRSHQLESKFSTVLNKWDQMKSLSSAYTDRFVKKFSLFCYLDFLAAQKVINVYFLALPEATMC